MGKGSRLKAVRALEFPKVDGAIVIPSEKYWQLRTAMLEHQARVEQSLGLLRQMFVGAGLDPTKNYNLSDATCSAVEA